MNRQRNLRLYNDNCILLFCFVHFYVLFLKMLIMRSNAILLKISVKQVKRSATGFSSRLSFVT